MEQKGAERERKGAERELKGAKREPKGAKREPIEKQRVPKGAKREPKGAQMEPKVSQKATKMHPNIALGSKVDIGEAICPKKELKGSQHGCQNMSKINENNWLRNGAGNGAEK